MAELVLEGVVKRYGETPAIRGLDMTVPDRSFTVVVGPSGCGKSTLLKLIAGLEEVDAGIVKIGGRRINHLPPGRRDVAMVFQSYALYPHMTVFQNLAFPLEMAGMSKPAIAAKVREVAAILRLETLLERRPGALSGGQQQRVAIGRALVRDPAVTLFDEPLSNLDAQLRLDMREEIARLHRDLGATVVYVTHDQVEAMTMAERIVVLNDGAVEQEGDPLGLYHRPANRFVAGFIGAPRMNFLPAAVAELDRAGCPRVVLPGGAGLRLPFAIREAGGAGMTLGVRPEHVMIADGGPGDAVLTGDIARIERLGAQTQLLVASDAGRLLVTVPGDRDLAERRLQLCLPAAACHLFDGAGLTLRADVEIRPEQRHGRRR